MKIYFYCDIELPNYKDNPLAYTYLHGRHSATGYYYWILKNHNVDVHIAHTKEQLSDADVVIFHYDNATDVVPLNCKKIQVVTDRPYVEGCDFYIAANKSILTPKIDIDVVNRYGLENTANTWLDNKDKWHFIHYPPTFGIKKCTPQFPPRNFKFVGRQHTMMLGMISQHFIKKCMDYNINLQYDFVNDGNDGTEDVYYCVRNINCQGKHTGLECNAGKHGHRTANRLYQAWYMNTPGIFNLSPEMSVLRETELDFLIANNKEEFLEQAIRLQNNKDLFYAMIENGNAKDDINPYSNIEIVVYQWINIFTKCYE